MKIKKLVAMLVCLAAAVLCLASCEPPIGDYLKDYDYKPDPVYNVTLDFYIICDDANTDDMAKSTVNEKINQVLGDRLKYDTKLNIIYLSEANYEKQLKVDLGMLKENDAEADTVGIYKNTTKLPTGYTYGGKIVLIKDSSMLSYLGDKLADLAPYLATTDFGTLNTQINGPLLAAADIDGKKLAIPNNRVYGEYQYVCINRAKAENILNFSALSEILDIKTPDDVEVLLNAYAKHLNKSRAELTEADVDSIVRYTNGQYDVKGLINAGNYVGPDTRGVIRDYKKDSNNNWMCNVMVYPTATLDVAYESAFGVIPSANLMGKDKDGNDIVAVDYAYRAMQIIYSFNDDVEMKNLLCYGVPNTNYRMENDVVEPLTEQGSNYKMDHKYCGDVFKSYYSAEWTKKMAESGKNQVKEAVLSE